MRRFLVSALLTCLITLPAAAADGAPENGWRAGLQPVEAFLSYLGEMLQGLFPTGSSAASCPSAGAGTSESGPCIEPHGLSQGGASVAACSPAEVGDQDLGPCIAPNG